MDKITYPPGSRIVLDYQGRYVVALDYARDIVILISSKGPFIITRSPRGYKMLGRTHFSKILGIPLPDDCSSECLLSKAYGKDYVDIVIFILHENLPQPIAEEIEEYFGWMPMKTLPIVLF